MAFHKIVDEVIAKSDAVLEVVDARLIELTRNEEIEKKVLELKKPLIIVINKCDLVPFEVVERAKRKLNNAIFLSARKHLGTNLLREKILSFSHSKKQVLTVGVIGYPNTGKSSVINMLHGRHSAKVSSKAGQTRGKQIVRVSQRLRILDTPGIIPFSVQDELVQVLVSARTERIKEPDYVAQKILELFHDAPEKVEELYGVQYGDDCEKLLENIALSKRKIKKGNLPDVEKAGVMVIQDWQRGKLNLV